MSIPGRWLRAPAVLCVLALLGAPTAAAQPVASLTYVSEFGGFGFYQPSFPANLVPPTGFAGIRGVDFYSATELVIADYDNLKLQLCQTDGSECRWFGRDNQSAGRNEVGTFDRPHGVEVSKDGRIAVADEDNHWIQYCGLDGRCQFSGTSGEQNQLPSSGLGRWAFPNDVAIDSAGLLYGLDRDNNRIQVLEPDVDMRPLDIFMGSGTAPGQLDRARGIAIGPDDQVVIADTGNDRVQVCDREAQCTVIGSGGSATGQFSAPVGVDVDDFGRIWVADTGNNRIQVCDSAGACLAFGAAEGYSFSEPHDVAVHRSGQVAVVDTGNNKIQLFRTEQALAVNAGFNDAWFNPETDGQGYLVTVFPDQGSVFVANFTFDSERPPAAARAVLGEPGHRWLTALGPLAGTTARLDVALTTGGTFDATDPPAVTTGGYGSFELEFLNCRELRLRYELPAIPQTRTVLLQRVTTDNVALCESLSELALGEGAAP